MAAELGTIVLVGTSGRVYSIDAQIPDAVASQVTWNSAGAATATSSSTFRALEDSFITDFSVATGTTCTGATLTSDGNPIVGGVLRFANQLNTLANRPKLAIPVRRGSFVGAITQ
jgi:hypothetical protein